VSGIESFPAEKISHAKYFRHPQTYKDKNVLLVGNGPSGADLANQLLEYATSVRRSVRSEPNALAVTNPKVKDVGPIKCFTGDMIKLVNGTTFTEIDVVIFCTGYLYSLPMFSKDSGFITEDGSYVHQLYDQTFYAKDPTLVFLGLPKKVIPFPTFQNQSIVVAKVWAGKLSLPSQSVMEKDEFARLEEKGFDGRKFHSFEFPSDFELAERWRKWAEQDKSEGWEKSMKPWRWTEDQVEYRKRAPDIKAAFLKELQEGKWDSFQLERP
jgi:cation diffusion facilitator CzcD-associated flavoprotein CzcO